MNYNIQNAAGRMSLTPQTTLEEMFEQGAEWMKGEIENVLMDVMSDIKDGYYETFEEVYDKLKNIID